MEVLTRKRFYVIISWMRQSYNLWRFHQQEYCRWLWQMLPFKHAYMSLSLFNMGRLFSYCLLIQSWLVLHYLSRKTNLVQSRISWACNKAYLTSGKALQTLRTLFTRRGTTPLVVGIDKYFRIINKSLLPNNPWKQLWVYNKEHQESHCCQLNWCGFYNWLTSWHSWSSLQ